MRVFDRVANAPACSLFAETLPSRRGAEVAPAGAVHELRVPAECGASEEASDDDRSAGPRRFTISSQSRHSARTVRTKRSAIAFACGARTGVLMIRIPSLAKTASKSRVNLLSRSRIRKRSGDGRAASVHANWRAG